MIRRYYSLVLAVLWLMLAVVLLAPDWVLPENARAKVAGPQMRLAGYMAAAFAAYNVVRWWAYRTLARKRAVRYENPFTVRKPPGEPGA